MTQLAALPQDERMVQALEKIADALTRWVNIERQRYEKQYPERSVGEASIGTADYRKPAQEEEGEEDFLAPWVGPREARLNARRAKSKK